MIEAPRRLTCRVHEEPEDGCWHCQTESFAAALDSLETEWPGCAIDPNWATRTAAVSHAGRPVCRVKYGRLGLRATDGSLGEAVDAHRELVDRDLKVLWRCEAEPSLVGEQRRALDRALGWTRQRDEERVWP